MKPILYLFSVAMVPFVLTGCVDAGAGVGPGGVTAGASVGMVAPNSAPHQDLGSPSSNVSQDKQTELAKL